MKTLELAKNTLNPPPEQKDLSQAIVKISDAMNSLLKSGLNRDAITVLLNHSTKVGITDIKAVLNGLDKLKSQYTTIK